METRKNGGWEAAQGRRRGVGQHDDGFTLAELMVSLAVLAVLSMIGVASYKVATSHTVHGVTRTSVHGSHLDASTLLARDVTDATTITKADTSELVLDVLRNKACETLDYKATTSLTLTTTFYQGTDCNGASQAKTQTLIPEITGATGFTYYSDVETVLTPPIDDLSGVKRIGWTLASEPAGFTDPITYTSAAAFTGHGDQTGSGTAAMQAKAAVLSVVTGTSEGRDAPVLSWVDPNPAGYVASWVLMRSANPEGMAADDPARTTWQQVGPVFPAAVTSFTDSSLPAGYTAIYVVRPTLADGGTAESSNPVVTGIRPSAPTGLHVTGGDTTLKLAWSAAVGATGYDVYRDGKLVANLGAVTAYTDGVGAYGWVANPADTTNGAVGGGYGHTHNYTVTAVNRWESLLTTASQNLRVTLGASVTQAYAAGTTRLTSNADGAFTTPAPPTLTATANTAWGYDLTWTPAGWVGNGPTSRATDGAATASWNLDRDPGPGASPSGAWTSLFTGRAPGSPTYTDTPGQAADASQWRHYRAASCNTWGCSPVSVVASALQRPSAPASCTAAKTGITTRQMQVTINPSAATIANTGYRLTGGSPAPSGTVTGVGDQPGTTFTLDHLAHGTNHTFTTYSRNASTANSGYSDPTSCSGATDTLTINAPSAWSVTTRSFSASFTYGNGTGQSITANGQTIGGSSGSWDLLADNRVWTVTGVNSDGDNSVSAAANVATPLLRTPTCSVSGGGTAPSGSITVTASGSNGTSQVAALGSGWYGSPHTWGISSTGSYTGTASATDGWNRSSAVNCGTVNVSIPYPTAWGVQAGCPALYYAPSSTSPTTWKVRRASSTRCEAEWIYTSYGEDIPSGIYAGDQQAVGYWMFGSGALEYYSASPNGVTTWAIPPGDYQP